MVLKAFKINTFFRIKRLLFLLYFWSFVYIFAKELKAEDNKKRKKD